MLASQREDPNGILRWLRSATRIALAAAFIAGANARADENFPQLWINAGFLTYHFDREKDLREDNIGIGVETVLSPDHALMAGNFINSNRVRTKYVGYQWRPLHWKPEGVSVSAGVAVAALDGYEGVNNGGWSAAPLPILAIEGKRIGVNFTVIPTIGDRVNGAVSAQIKIRIW